MNRSLSPPLHKSVTITGFVKNVEMLHFLLETLIPSRALHSTVHPRPSSALSPSAGYSLSALFSPYYRRYFIYFVVSTPLSLPLFSLVRRIRYCFFLCFFRAANPLFSKNFLSILRCLTITQSISCRRRRLHNNQ